MEEKKKGFFSRLVEGLTKTRENIVSGMDSIFSGFSAIDDDFSLSAARTAGYDDGSSVEAIVSRRERRR